jgi:hypothetical protein
MHRESITSMTAVKLADKAREDGEIIAKAKMHATKVTALNRCIFITAIPVPPW